MKGIETREEDFVSSIFVANTFTTLLVFSDKGKVYWIKVHRLPAGTRTSKGKAIANVVNLAGGEKVKAILPVDDFETEGYVVLLTEQGTIKKTPLSAYSRPRPSGIIALTVDLDDSLVGATLSSGQNDIFVATSEGMSIRFNESNVRPMGRTARGVKAITLAKDDKVVGLEILDKQDPSTILMVTERGFGKRTPATEYRPQSRGGVGLITQKVTDKVGKVIGTVRVSASDDVMIITDKGQVIRLVCAQISEVGRNTQGVKLINLKDGEGVTGMAIVAEVQTPEGMDATADTGEGSEAETDADEGTSDPSQSE
jgi:DNA gyrase subunit A